jgi:hypothetical protein
MFNPPQQAGNLVGQLDAFLAGEQRLFRVCLSAVCYEFSAREVIANVIGKGITSLISWAFFMPRCASSLRFVTIPTPPQLTGKEARVYQRPQKPE